MGYPDMTEELREQIVQFILVGLKNERPARGKITEATITFDCCRKTVSRIWAAAKTQREKGEVIHIQLNRTTRIREKIHKVNHEAIHKVHYRKRCTIRKLVVAIDVPKTTVGRWVKKKLIRSHKNAIKPDLTAPNKLLRLSFTLQAIEFDRCRNILKFKPMQNTIHIDENWFFLTKPTNRCYLTPIEVGPHRSCKSKKFIPKVMFMYAVSRPIFGPDGAVIFDGKIRVWPFTEPYETKRKSKHRPAGTMETRPIQSITKEVIKDCLLKQIIPAIKRQWPSCLSKVIIIQQDNAKSHIKDSDIEFRAAASSGGFQISLIQQPPNSPDTNVNYLGWFRAIQSIQEEEMYRNAADLVNAVVGSFNNLDPTTLNKVFLSLQCCMQEILKVEGHNNYKLPHMKKDALIRQNALPTDLEVPKELVRDNIHLLIEAGRTEGIGELMAALDMIPV